MTAGARLAPVVGLALRFALNARPSGSQGRAPGKANDQEQEQKQKGDTSNEVRKGTFLKSLDTLAISTLAIST